MSRPIQAIIDYSALAHNLTIVRQHAPNARILAVLKANAYGHGLLHTAKALKNVDGFALLELDAAITLRATGYQQPILLLEGFFSTEEIALVKQYQLSFVIHHTEQVSMLSDFKNHKMDIFIKINTGMNRLGLSPKQLPQVMKELTNNQHVKNITLMTHFASADDPSEKTSVLRQLRCFETITEIYNYPCSLANSAAIVNYPETHSDWVRPGIMLYGASPLPDKTAADLNLLPVMTLSSKIIAIHNLEAGDKVGYHGLFKAEDRMRIGIVACGYADGYPRHAPTGTPILVNNQRSRLLGRISMDMLAIDLTGVKNTKLGDPVVLWGKGMPVEEIAMHAGASSYQILCGLSARVDRKFLKSF